MVYHLGGGIYNALLGTLPLSSQSYIYRVAALEGYTDFPFR